jgi:hypothetical protein
MRSGWLPSKVGFWKFYCMPKQLTVLCSNLNVSRKFILNVKYVGSQFMVSYSLIYCFLFYLYSGQVDSQLQVTGSILRPDVSGMIRLSHGEAYLPHDKGNGAVTTRLASNKSSYLPAGFGQTTTSQDVSRFLGALSTSPDSMYSIKFDVG